MQLTVLGSNGTYPTAGRPGSGYLVTHEGTALWIDAGPGTYVALASEMDPRNVDAVVLSHRHPDHCVDVFALFHAAAYGDRPRSGIPLLVPEGLEDRLCTFLETSGESMRTTFDFRRVGAGDRAEIGSITLTFEIANHPPPTIAPRLTAGEKTLVYTADTGPSELLERHAAGCDLLVAEATLQGPRTPDQIGFHMTGAEAGAMAMNAGARRLMLTHIAPHIDPNQSVSDAEAVFNGEVSVAVPGRKVMV